MAEKNIILKSATGDTLYPEVAAKNKVMELNLFISSTAFSNSSSSSFSNGLYTNTELQNIFQHIISGGQAFYKVTGQSDYNGEFNILVPMCAVWVGSSSFNLIGKAIVGNGYIRTISDHAHDDDPMLLTITTTYKTGNLCITSATLKKILLSSDLEELQTKIDSLNKTVVYHKDN